MGSPVPVCRTASASQPTPTQWRRMPGCTGQVAAAIPSSVRRAGATRTPQRVTESAATMPACRSASTTASASKAPLRSPTPRQHDPTSTQARICDPGHRLGVGPASVSLPLSIAGVALLARADVRLRCEEDNSGVPTLQLEVSLVRVDLLCIVSSHVGGCPCLVVKPFRRLGAGCGVRWACGRGFRF